jgi:NAD(P)-dependent dehydrogenase (short-subunit alcohol dehydrogenase family)
VCPGAFLAGTPLRVQIDSLFNNVGIQPEHTNRPIHQLGEDAWDLILNVNLKASAKAARGRVRVRAERLLDVSLRDPGHAEPGVGHHRQQCFDSGRTGPPQREATSRKQVAVRRLLTAKSTSLPTLPGEDGLSFAVCTQDVTRTFLCSKGALVSLTRQLAVQYGGQGIRVNAVSPGSTVTPLGRKNTDFSALSAHLTRRSKSVPLPFVAPLC